MLPACHRGLHAGDQERSHSLWVLTQDVEGLAHCGGGALQQQVGQDHAGGHGVHLDLGALELCRQTPTQLGDTGLGGAVCGVLWCCKAIGARPIHVEDVPLLLLPLEQPHGQAGAQHSAKQVGGDHLVEGGRLAVQEVAEAAAVARIVDPGMHSAAAEGLLHNLLQGSDALGISHITDSAVHLRPGACLLPELLHSLVHPLLRPAGDEDPVARSSQLPGNSLAQTLGTPRDNHVDGCLRLDPYSGFAVAVEQGEGSPDHCSSSRRDPKRVRSAQYFRQRTT
mmetsp:Transcript_30114/g.66764  ORF Transcript_30114/g.66764 Transcript_30114/m.66764 type:complete len:281 (+) Transcript_30114:1323-2165(+)